MNNVIPLQNSPERVSLLPIAPGVDFATALSLRRMATSTGATPAYLLAPEVSALLFYMPDQRHHMLFATLWNTGMRIGEARMLTLVAASCEPGISISKLALENGINANLLFKWRQQWREGSKRPICDVL
ncbi:hypothetical protein C6520_23610 [Escherichia coli]|nr:hypothetical protein [Escherichia coli]